MKLRDLLAIIEGITQLPIHPALDTEVKGLKANSHTCSAGDVFIGVPGNRVDGGYFWHVAIASGALAAIISPQAAANNPPNPKDCVVVAAQNMNQICGQLATAFYDYPAEKLKLVGVTGTNGKTTITHLIEHFLKQAQQPTALMGTLYQRWQGFEQTAVHTTPFAIELQAQLAAAVNTGNKYGVMEVSSHALAQGRILGCQFQASVFSNLTQDHLDFHENMEDYFRAKSLLFYPNYLQGAAIINIDDAYGRRLIKSIDNDNTWSYSTHDSSADLCVSNLIYEPNKVSGILHTPKGDITFVSPLVGQYNLENLLAAVGAVLHLGVDSQIVSEAIKSFPGVPGRMEKLQISPSQDISVIVDYAHTPDGLENLLRASRPFIPRQMICVFGCGGDRDQTKRPKMGNIAAELADIVIITSDNPRTEDPEKILQNIVDGITTIMRPIVISDRSQAIHKAIIQAQSGDGVIIAGKGHENYQILGTEKIYFDDREHARQALANRNSSKI